MMRIVALLSCCLLFIPVAQAKYYGERLCKNPNYHCIKAKPGDNWHNLFPNAREREIVRKVNRMNIQVKSGMLIAVPKNLRTTDYLSLAPFPRKISTTSSTMIKVDLNNLAWGAYNANGQLVNWGPISGGKNYCADVGRGCKTLTGTFTIYRKQGAGCRSSKYPIPRGGAPMPYCMHFYKGYAMHGSPTVPGHHASHGCIRMFTEDARWLNQNFIRVGATIVKIFR